MAPRTRTRTQAPQGWVKVESLLDYPTLWTGPSGLRYQFEAKTQAAVQDGDLSALLATQAFKVV